jgi:ABC-type transport system involved in cytochrome bd biosynthesis fused ATPase/permease subunit
LHRCDVPVGNLLSHLTLTQRPPGPAVGRRGPPLGVWDLLAEFGLAHRAMAYPAQLTQGAMVRAALAVALVNDPAVLLVDEPTAGLDGDDEELVIDGLLRRVARGLAVLVASRSEAVLAVADRIVTLDRPIEPATWQWDIMVPFAA